MAPRRLAAVRCTMEWHRRRRPGFNRLLASLWGTAVQKQRLQRVSAALQPGDCG